MSKERVRKSVWVALAALVALHIYFIRELIAAELLFTMLFGILLVFGLLFYVVSKLSERGVSWAESHATGLLGLARRQLVGAEAEGSGSFNRPDSDTAR